MGKVIKKDYTSGEEVVTDVSDEIVEIFFTPSHRKKDQIHFKIKRRYVMDLINLLRRSFEGEKIQTFKIPITVQSDG